jgi:hypothetical protein
MPWRHMGERRYSSTFIDLGTGWKWVVSFTPRPLYPRRKNPRCPLDRRLGGPQSRSGSCGGQKILYCRELNAGSPAPVTVPTELSRLLTTQYSVRLLTNVEQAMKWELENDTEVLGGNPPQCHVVHHKSHLTWSELEPGPPRWEAGHWPPERGHVSARLCPMWVLRVFSVGFKLLTRHARCPAMSKSWSPRKVSHRLH